VPFGNKKVKSSKTLVARHSNNQTDNELSKKMQPIAYAKGCIIIIKLQVS